jgi:hypothetical protein
MIFHTKLRIYIDWECHICFWNYRLQTVVFCKKSWSIRKIYCLWRPCLLTDWEQISKLYRELSIDAEYPVSIHLNKWFKKRRFTCEQLAQKNWKLVGSISTRSSVAIAHLVLTHWKTCPPQAILVFDWSISISLLLWTCLPQWTYDGRQVMAKAHFALSGWSKKCLSHSTEIDKCIGLTENNCLQSIILFIAI